MKTPSPLSTTLLSVITCVLLTGAVQSQQDQRQEFIEGLFRSIIESRTERNRQQPQLQPPVPPAAIAPPVQQTPNEISAYRSEIGSFAQQANTLANNLNQDSVRTPALRAYLPDLYSVRSHALLLQQNARHVQNLSAVQSDFRSLDVLWRDLSYRLKMDSSLDNQCRATVDQIDRHGSSLCGILGLQADFDRIKATVIAAQASAYVDSLLDVLQHELYNQPNCNALINEGRQHVELARQLAMNSTQYSMEEAVNACKEWVSAWSLYSYKLHSFQNPPLARAVGRVRHCQDELFDLMRIDHAIDYSYLSYLSAQCQRATNELFGSLSVRSLSTIPRNQIEAFLSTEHILSRQFGNLANSLNGTPNHDRVVREFLAMERTWNDCANTLNSFSGDVASYQATIDTHISEMRNILQVSNRIDMEALLTRAASLEGLATAFYANISNTERFLPPSVKKQVFIQSQTFLQNTKILHAQVSNNSDYPTLQQRCTILLDSWRDTSHVIRSLPGAGMQPQFYAAIERARAQIDPAMAELAVILTP